MPTGLLCHLDDACISNPCHKGALCDTNPLNGQYICTCPQGYKGADCTEDVDECAMGECATLLPVHHGVCQLQQVFKLGAANPRVCPVPCPPLTTNLSSTTLYFILEIEFYGRSVLESEYKALPHWQFGQKKSRDGQDLGWP